MTSRGAWVNRLVAWVDHRLNEHWKRDSRRIYEDVQRKRGRR